MTQGTEVLAYQHGLYPRSEHLVAATRDLDRGRTDTRAVAEQRREDYAEFVQLQREAGLDYLATGQQSWQDVFRPLVLSSAGLSPGSLTRWFDNNTFYRVPVLDGQARLDPDRFVAEGNLEHAPDPGIAVLPGPYTLSRVAVTDEDRNAAMGRLARDVLRPAAEVLDGLGYRLIHLEEPWLAWHGLPAEAEQPLATALTEIRAAAAGRLALHTYFADPSGALPYLRSLPVDLAGMDLLETDLGSLAGQWETGLLVGCIDGRSSTVEDVATVTARARHALETARPAVLALSSTCELECVPRAIADQKVRVLGEAARRLREEA